MPSRFPDSVRATVRAAIVAEPDVRNRDIAGRFGVSKSYVDRIRQGVAHDEIHREPHRRRQPRRATTAEIRRAQLLADEGVPQVEICRRLDRPQSTVSHWLSQPRPTNPRSLADARTERRVRRERAWRQLVELNTHALAVWEDRHAMLSAIESTEDENGLVALGLATERSLAVLREVTAAIDVRLSDEDRGRVKAFLVASGFGV